MSPAPQGDAPTRIAVAPIQVYEEAPAPLVAELNQAAATGPERANAVPLRLAADGCPVSAEAAQCWRELVGDQAPWLLTVSVTRNGPDVAAHAEIVDVSTDRSVAAFDSTCEICGEREIVQLVEDLTAQAARELTAVGQGAKATISGTPANAHIFIDGEDVGTKGFEGKVGAGEHQATIVASGYSPQLVTWQAQPGVTAKLSYTLVPLPDQPEGPEVTECEASAPLLGPSPEEVAHTRKKKIIGATTLGVGIAGLGAGVGLLVLDGRFHSPSCSADVRDINGLCPKSWSAKMPGAIAASAGAALTGLGIGLLVDAIRHKKEQRKSSARIRRLHRRASF